METLWFWLLAAMFCGYVVFDGFDLGAGILHLFVGKQPGERGLVLRTIGPVWDGNEVWLLAAGGTLFFVFPALYAATFSGFYLALMIVLWLLILRGASIEMRHQVESPLWKGLFDVVFSLSSLALALLFGAALGNIVRGVPLDAEGWFFLPLWTDLSTSAPLGLVDWYTLLVGLLSTTALALHGALWLVLKGTGEVHRRATDLAPRLWWGTVGAALVVTFASGFVRPGLFDNFTAAPAGLALPALALLSLWSARRALQRRAELAAFLGSSGFLVGMLASVAYSLHPVVLPAIPGEPHSLTLENAASGTHGLTAGLAWWIPGMLLVAASFTFTYRRFAGKVAADDDAH